MSKKTPKKTSPAKARKALTPTTNVPYKLSPPKSHGKNGHRKQYTLPVMVYFTKEQKTQLTEFASKKGLPLSAFIREQALAGSAPK